MLVGVALGSTIEVFCKIGGTLLQIRGLFLMPCPRSGFLGNSLTFTGGGVGLFDKVIVVQMLPPFQTGGGFPVRIGTGLQR